MPQREEEVFCHLCRSVFPKAEYGLRCPNCDSEFTEIIEPNGEHPAAVHQTEPEPEPEPSRPPRRSSRRERSPRREASRSPASSLRDHHPWAEMDAEVREFGNGGGFSRQSYRSPDGRFTFTSTTFSTGMPSRRMRGGFPDVFPEDDAFMRTFNSIFQSLAGTQFDNGLRDRDRDPLRGDDLHPPWLAGENGDRDRPRNPLHGGLWPRDADNPQPMAHPLESINDILNMFQTDFPFDRQADRPTGRGGIRIMEGNPLSIIASILNAGRNGDAVYSQEELDRVISQLIDQNVNGNGAPPASQSAIRALPKKKVDREMLGPEGKAECSICMDSVELGTEVAVLPCKHWFHYQCIEMWLNQHNTCPHCRRGINNPPQENAPGTRENPLIIPSSPESPAPRRRSSGTEHNHQYSYHPYRNHRHNNDSSNNNGSSESRRGSSSNRTPSSAEERRRSTRTEGHGGGISGWVRSHFGGS